MLGPPTHPLHTLSIGSRTIGVHSFLGTARQTAETVGRSDNVTQNICTGRCSGEHSDLAVGSLRATTDEGRSDPPLDGAFHLDRATGRGGRKALYSTNRRHSCG